MVADPSMYAPLPPLFSQTMRGLSHPLCPPLPPKQHALNLKNLIEKSGATRCGSSQPPADCCLSAAAQRIARVLEVFCSRYARPRGGDAAPHDECDARLARSVCCSKAVDACGRRGDGVSCEACCACGQCHVRRARSGALAANSSSFMPCCRRLHSDVLQAFVSTAVGSERAQLLRPFGGGGKVCSVYGGFLSPRLH